MHLKSITVKGFKSFPDRTRLEFGPGVSVIVGPNGSGKSNVTDAVLWALGEQSPLAIRGQSMQDVIFGGAPGRQAAAYAEVELVLDDSDGSLGLGMPEIAIQRRLDRTGDGEYRLGGARCRLVDVVELLSDTGLGREMHSVISQGRVESLVTSKPRERRLLIEEAAGLGKHRKRRRRAQLKLARTQDNLDRALDVEREARSRLRPLKRQAEAAELHARLERQALEIHWQLVRDDAIKRRGAVAAAEQGATSARERRRALELKLETVASRREEAEETLAARSAEREELSRRAYSARAAAERVSYRLESVRSAARAVDARLERWGAVAETLEQQLAAEREDPEAAAQIAGLKESIAALDRDREAELERELARLGLELDAAQARVTEQERAVQDALARREQSESSVEAARAELREAERAAEAARREAARVGGELSVANQFLRSHAGTPGGAAALSDELEVDAGFELAVAAALDGRLGAAVVDDLPVGGSLLDRAGSDGGRVLVAWPAGPGGSTPPSPPPLDGAVPLLEHVRGRGHALALARSLLRDVWLVDDLAALPSAFRGVAVTTSGRVWVTASRELRQAAAHGEERVLAERNRRDALIADSELAAQRELQARAIVEASSAALARADSEHEQVTGLHRTAVRALDEAVEERGRIAALIERRRNAPDDGPDAGRRAQLEAELGAEERMLSRVARDRADRQDRLLRLRDVEARDRELVPALAALVSALEDAAAAIAGGREAFDQALAADRQAGESVAAALRACAREEAELQAALGRENECLMEAEVRLQRARDHCAESEAELTRLAAALELDNEAVESELDDEQRADLDARLERLARRREQIGPVNPLAQQEYAEAVDHVEALEAQRADLEAALRELEHLIADTDRQIRTSFEQTFAATAAAFEELVEQLFPGGKGRLRLVADGEASGRPARVIGGQPAPAQEGGSGTDADEDADEEEETQEELLGVEIEITPAGKERRRLSLLSGGEKSMTALAFLFAVFLARPCPFYILDEVEAALDDLNIDRFLTLLRRYSSRAQFIVVTHQKRTMEAADSLYGVSMSADGVSKVISRRLPDVVEAA